MAIYVSIVMYCLRLFIVVLQELHSLQTCNFPILWSLRISCKVSFLNSVRLYTLVETEEEEEEEEEEQQQQNEE